MDPSLSGRTCEVADGFRLCAATNADAAAIANLVREVLAEYGLMFDPDGIDSDLKDIEHSYHFCGGVFDILVDDTERVTGSVGLVPVNSDTCELRKMYLARSARGRGQGRRLLDHALARASALGFTRVTLETATVLREAIALYERAGFRPCTPEHLSSRCNLAYFLDLKP
jgi:putative acetyltransferase